MDWVNKLMDDLSRPARLNGTAVRVIKTDSGFTLDARGLEAPPQPSAVIEFDGSEFMIAEVMPIGDPRRVAYNLIVRKTT